MLPKNVNPKFYKKWRYAKIVKMTGPLNVQVMDENDRTSQQIREDCDSILSPYEDDIQTGVAHEEPREKDRKVDEFDEKKFGPYTCTASSQPGQQQPDQQQPGQQQKRRHVGTIPKQRSQGQIPLQIPQHESRVRPSVIETRGERDKFPTSAAVSASAYQEPGPSTLKQKKGVRWQQEEAEYEAEQEQFLPTEQREEDSDFYGFDKEEEENVEGDELNAGFSQPPSMAAWVTSFARGYFPGAAKKADNVRREQAREKERQRAHAEEEMQEDFRVHNEKNLAAQKAQQQRQLDKKEKKQQTPVKSLGENQGRESTREHGQQG
jgi:hypothetical protein